MPWKKMIAAVVAVSLLVLSGGCSTRRSGEIPKGGDQAVPTPAPSGTPAAPATPATPSTPEPSAPGTPTAVSTFAAHDEIPVNVVPSVKPYTVARDLSNVTNRDMFRLSDAAKDLLARNGFVVVPNKHLKEFFWVYEDNRYRPAPSFVTVDSMLHNYHLFFAHLLRVLETERFIPELKSLNKAMLAAARRQYSALRGTSWENAARRNVGFFAVGSVLMDPAVALPAEVRDEVSRELALIAAHEGIALSPVLNIGSRPDIVEGLKEDYSQYVPRGHYERTEELKAYFKAMTWYGRLTFRLKSEDETKSAVLVTLALSEGNNLASWNRIYEPTSFFVGRSDDISPLQFRELLDRTYGSRVELKRLTSDQAAWTAFLEAAAKLEPPAVNSIPIFDESIQPDREREIRGFRFMGQRFTIDASIFQRLVYREVKENGSGARRMLPKALDIPAALGSEEAYGILKSMGETDYRLYPENMARLRAYLATLDGKTWTQNLYWSWLHTLLPLLQRKPEGYPSFMRNSAWARKELNTFLGSWVELKHDTILYSKPIYAEAGGGDLGVDDRGYVEPNPHVYGRLASLAKRTREGLKSRGLLAERDEASLERLEQLALSLKTISEKELGDTPLTDAEYDLIRAYGVQLEHFWLEALRDEGVDHRSQSFDRPAAVVVDVATDPNGRVLEEATGNIFEIYAVVPVDGKLRVARGGVYSYYEFTQPINERLTDSAWHRMLNEGRVPPLPGWTKDFIAE